MSHHTPEIRPAASRVRVSRPVLWLLLAVFMVGNMVANMAGLHLVGVGFGLATLACAAALIVQHYDNRRRSSS